MPLVILAICSVFAGYLGLPHSLGGTNRFEKFLSPVFASETHVAKAEGEVALVAAREREEEHTNPVEYALMFLSVGAAIGGWFMASRAYGKAAKGYKEPVQVAAPPVYTTLLNKYYVDEAYDYAFTGRKKLGPVRLGAIGLGEASWKFDANVIDGSVNGAGWITRFSAALSNWWDKWIIDGLLVNGPAIVAKLLSYPTRLLEWGLVQWYALVMVTGLVGFVWYYAIR
jgi:NADH-quinone oxidoreductase subunit L